MSYSNRFYDIIQDNEELKKCMFLAAPGGLLKAPYFSFFYERLLTEILSHHPEIKVKGFRFPKKWYDTQFTPDISKLLFELDWSANLQQREDLCNAMTFWRSVDLLIDSEHLFYNYRPVKKFVKGTIAGFKSKLSDNLILN
jgi:hypothetical protein